MAQLPRQIALSEELEADDPFSLVDTCYRTYRRRIANQGAGGGLMCTVCDCGTGETRIEGQDETAHRQHAHGHDDAVCCRIPNRFLR